MKIKRPEKKTRTFAEIEEGSVFEYCGQYCIKIRSQEFYDCSTINAVNLADGDTLEIDGYEPVIPLPNAELIF